MPSGVRQYVEKFNWGVAANHSHVECNSCEQRGNAQIRVHSYTEMPHGHKPQTSQRPHVTAKTGGTIRHRNPNQGNSVPRCVAPRTELAGEDKVLERARERSVLYRMTLIDCFCLSDDKRRGADLSANARLVDQEGSSRVAMLLPEPGGVQLYLAVDGARQEL